MTPRAYRAWMHVEKLRHMNVPSSLKSHSAENAVYYENLSCTLKRNQPCQAPIKLETSSSYGEICAGEQGFFQCSKNLPLAGTRTQVYGRP
jgi:hypothetical protein